MPKKFKMYVSFSGSGYVSMVTEDDETLEDLQNLTDEELSMRVAEFSDLLDLVEDRDIEVEDIMEDK